MNVIELITRLEKLDTCAVSDALDSLGVPGVADGIVRRSTRQSIAGRVRTMQLAAGKQPESNAPHLGTRSIEEACDTDVIVLEQRTGINAACWGGILSEAAHHKHIRGVVIEGPARDVDEINETGLPLFSRSITPTAARGRIHEVAVNVPVDIGGIAVEPGDFVIADGSGVVFIPAAIAEEAISKAEWVAAKERRMVEAVHENKSITEIMDSKYENLLDRAD
jgi:4-hydroxy-4-methyl-2-oxoglutarate aldolase